MQFQVPLTFDVESQEQAELLRMKIEKMLVHLPIELGETFTEVGEPAAAAKDGTIMVWTDGGCDTKKNGIGAWAFVIKASDGTAYEHFESESETTNNRMELTAVIRALEALEIGPQIVIYSDSEYVIKGCTQWAKNWVKNGWKTYQGGQVINRDLWEILIALYQLHNVRFEWVKGHSGIPENERCDELCTAAMTALYKEALAGGVQ